MSIWLSFIVIDNIFKACKSKNFSGGRGQRDNFDSMWEGGGGVGSKPIFETLINLNFPGGQSGPLPQHPSRSVHLKDI